MNELIIYIGIIWPQSCFDYTNFRASLFIKIINLNEIQKTTHLTMLIIFYVDLIFCQYFNLPHIYCIFVENTHLKKWKLTN
jgi:hypothetical protein